MESKAKIWDLESLGEVKAGETVEYKGNVLLLDDSAGCDDCFFRMRTECDMVPCRANERVDRTPCAYVRKEGSPYAF